jgi:hypothetical protein
MGQGILLWLLGVPIPIIIILALFFASLLLKFVHREVGEREMSTTMLFTLSAQGMESPLSGVFWGAIVPALSSLLLFHWRSWSLAPVRSRFSVAVVRERRIGDFRHFSRGVAHCSPVVRFRRRRIYRRPIAYSLGKTRIATKYSSAIPLMAYWCGQLGQ